LIRWGPLSEAGIGPTDCVAGRVNAALPRTRPGIAKVNTLLHSSANLAAGRSRGPLHLAQLENQASRKYFHSNGLEQASDNGKAISRLARDVLKER
jgi:hypothetical protein